MKRHVTFTLAIVALVLAGFMFTLPAQTPTPAKQADAPKPPETIALSESEKAALDTLLKDGQAKSNEIQSLELALKAARAEMDTLRAKYQALEAQARAEHSCKDCVLNADGKVLVKAAPQAAKK